MKKDDALFIVMFFSLILMMFDPVMARDISFQPRLDCGVMYYEFESEVSSWVVPRTADFTKSAFSYSDYMPFVSTGGTLFMNRFFLDLNWQYAFDGQDSESIAKSMYLHDEYDEDHQFWNSHYLADLSNNTVEIDRHDIAISFGTTLTHRLSLFAGYKWAKTQFDETYGGPVSVQFYDKIDDKADYLGGRFWGKSTFKFDYHGPFVGFIQGWNFSQARLLKGTLTANMALAYLTGKVTNDKGTEYISATWVDDQPVSEPTTSVLTNSSSGSRNDTEGDALGLTVGFGWRGLTALEGLSYTVGISAYRYEFDAKTVAEPNINETAVNFKLGLAYIF